MIKDQRKAYLYGLVTVLLWSTVASAFKLSLRHLHLAQLLLYASLVSLLALGGILALQGKMGGVRRCARRQYGRAAVLGFLNPFLYYLVLFKAYDLLPAQEAQPLNYTWALTLTYLSIPLLKQRLGKGEIAAGLISYSGVLVIATRGDLAGLRFSDPLGVGLALGSTVIWALYWIFNARGDLDPIVGLFLNFLFGLPWVLGFCLLFAPPAPIGWSGFLGATYVGLFEMGITFATWLTALRHSEQAARVGNLIFLSPFLSLIFIHFLVGEKIFSSTFVGLVLIVGGLCVQQLWKEGNGIPRKGAL